MELIESMELQKVKEIQLRNKEGHLKCAIVSEFAISAFLKNVINLNATKTVKTIKGKEFDCLVFDDVEVFVFAQAIELIMSKDSYAKFILA